MFKVLSLLALMLVSLAALPFTWGTIFVAHNLVIVAGSTLCWFVAFTAHTFTKRD